MVGAKFAEKVRFYVMGEHGLAYWGKMKMGSPCLRGVRVCKNVTSMILRKQYTRIESGGVGVYGEL